MCIITIIYILGLSLITFIIYLMILNSNHGYIKQWSKLKFNIIVYL